jgi:ferredoxin-type protein NapH
MKKQIPLRQRVRQILLVASLLLFPVTMNYLSPYVVVDGAIQGILAASPIIFGIQLLTALLLGRTFCGWVCPAGKMQDLCTEFNNQPVNGRKIDWIKWAIWAPWLGTIIFFLMKAGSSLVINPFHLTETGVSVDTPLKFLNFYAVALIFLLIAGLAGRRAACHSICWMAPFMILGEKLGSVLHLPRLRLLAQSEKCTNCQTCNTHCPMSLPVNDMVRSSHMENSECILCGNCVDGCTKKAIHYRFGLDK